MSTQKKANRLTLLLFGAAVVLLAGSVAGSSRAALTYYNENYQANLEMSDPIGVTVTVNDPNAQAGTEGNTGITELPKLVPGKKYPVSLEVENSGEIDAYVRVILRCYWKDANGKRRDVSPELIEKGIPEGWIVASAPTPEQTFLYYPSPLAKDGKVTLMGDVSVKADVAKHATWNTEGTTTTYDYDGLTLVVEVEADAVQTHSPQAAMESAWGVNVTLDGETITGVK